RAVGASPEQQAAVAAMCRAQSFQSEGALIFQPAGSVAEGVIRLVNRRRTPCLLPRNVTLLFVAAGHPPRIRQLSRRLDPGERVVRLLRPHRNALLRIAWGNWCRAWFPSALVVRARTGGLLMNLRVTHAPNCYVPSRVSEVGVTPFFRVVRPTG